MKEYAAKIRVELEGVVAVMAKTEKEAIQKIREKLRTADLDLDNPLIVHVDKIVPIRDSRD
jgi:hypothetical protein